MTSDGDHNDPKGADDPFGGGDLFDDEGWEDALDEWDQCLDSLQDEPDGAVAAQASPAAPEEARGSTGVDPLVDFIEGPMEIPDQEGEALGSLLGGAGAAAAPEPAVEHDDLSAEIGLSPDEVTAAEVDHVQVSARGFDDAAPAAVVSHEAAAPVVEEEPTPVSAVSAEVAVPQEEPTPTGMAPVAPESSAASAGFDLDGLMEDLAGIGPDEVLHDPPGSAGARASAAAAPAPAEPPPTDLLPDDEQLTEPPPLELFDEIVPAEEAEPEPEPEPVEAGEVLPARPAQAASAGPPTSLPVDLEDLDEPELQPPEIPAELSHVDPAQIQIPEGAAPVEPPRLYWERLAEHLELEANLTETASRAADLEFAAARASEAIGETDEALDHLREVLNHVPGHVPAMRCLRRIHAARGEADQVAEALGQMAERVGDEESRALRLGRAELLWAFAGDDDGAAGLVEGLGAPHSRGLRSLSLRADLCAARGEGDELEGVLQRMAERLDDDAARAAVQVEFGRRREAAGSPGEARVAYRAALAARPGCSAALEGLLRTGQQLEERATVREALEQSASVEGVWSARRLRRAALLAGADGDDAEARRLLDRARELTSDEPLVLEQLAERLLADGDHAGAVEVYGLLGSTSAGQDHRALALKEAARIAETRLGDAERATELYDRALTMLPDSPGLQTCSRVLMQESPDPELRLRALRQEASARTGGQRAALHLAAATLLLKELSREEDALSQLLECLEHDPGSRTALALLSAIYRERGQMEELAAVLDTGAEAAEAPQDVVEHRIKAALLYEGPLGRIDVALRRYRDLAQVEEGRALGRAGVLRCLRRLDRPEDLGEFYAEEAALSAEAAEAARLWTESADLLLRVGRADEARASYQLALDRAPECLAAQWSVSIVHGMERAWEPLAELWTRLWEALPEERPERRAWQMRVATLWEFALQEPGRAAGAYEAASAGPGAAPGARQGLLRVSRRAESPDRIVQELERELELSTDSSTRFALLVSAAELMNRVGLDPGEAEQKLHQAARELPDHPAARYALEQHLLHQRDQDGLARLLRERLEGSGEAAQRLRLHERLARLELARGETAPARTELEAMVELEPTHLRALRALQRRALLDGERDLLAQLLAAEARALPSVDAVSAWLETAHVTGHREEADGSVHSHDRAALRAALEADIGCTIALRLLVDAAWADEDQQARAEYYIKLADAVGDGREAAVFLTRAGEAFRDQDLTPYRRAVELAPDYLGGVLRLRDAALRTGRWDVAADAAEAEARACLRPEHRAFASLLAGELCRRRLDDTERAMAAYRAALDAELTNQLAFEQLRAHLERAGSWQELADLLEERTQIERSRQGLVDLHQQLAGLARDQLGDRDRAKHHLRVLLKLKPEDPHALATLVDLYWDDEQWPEAANALIRIARQEKDTARLADLFLRLGHIYQEKTPDRKRAIASLRKVITLAPDNIDALQRLGGLYLEDLDHERALQVYEALAEHAAGSEDRVQHLLQVAKIREDGFKDPHQAAIAYRQALEIAPMDLQAIGEVIGFFVRQGDQRSLMVHLDRSVATMRGRLLEDPFDPFAYRALFKIFGWRKAPDACLCAAQALAAVAQPGKEQVRFLKKNLPKVGDPAASLADAEFDEWMFDRAIPGGFRHVFRLLSEAFSRYYPGDIRAHRASRADRVVDIDHPARRVGDELARHFAIPGGSYDLYELKSNPTTLAVENTSPPSVLIGKALLVDASAEELRFMLGRCMWLISRSMVLPAALAEEELELLVAGIVRQYNPDFEPPEVDYKRLQDTTKKVGRAIPRKLKQELMPFALECSGPSVHLRGLRQAVVGSANRAGLMAAHSLTGPLDVLCKIRGSVRPPASSEDRVQLLRGFHEAEQLLRFAVSDAHLELRRGMHVAIR